MVSISDIKACFKFVSGVLNGAFDESAIVAYMPPLKRLMPEKDQISFLDACDALASAIDDGSIPAAGVKVLTEFSKDFKSHGVLPNSRLHISLGLPAESSPAGSTLQDSQDSQCASPDSQESHSASTTVQGNDSDQSFDEEDLEPKVDKVDEKQLADEAECVALPTEGAKHEEVPRSAEQSKANKLFRQVAGVLIGSMEGGAAESFKVQCAELAACVRAREVPKNGRIVLRDNQAGKGGDFSIAGQLAEALQVYACQLCLKCEPDLEKCASCKGCGKAPCKSCKGTGRFRPSCRACDGTGRGRTKPACPVCQGCGLKDVGECRACSGAGTHGRRPTPSCTKNGK
jgi:hypothetical protein